MFFLTFFFFGSSRPVTCSDTCYGASCFQVGLKVGFWAVLGVVQVDLGVDCFFLLRLSIVSAGRDKIMGGPELRVQGRSKATLRDTIGEVVVFMWQGRGGSVGFIMDSVSYTHLTLPTKRIV